MTLFVNYSEVRNIWTAYSDDEQYSDVEGTRDSTAFSVVADWAEQNNVPMKDALAELSLVSLGWVLEPYHDGGHIYAVMSLMILNETPADPAGIRLAIRALRRLRQDAKHPEAVTDEDVIVNNLLAAELERRFADMIKED